jgi:hypothetical protein
MANSEDSSQTLAPPYVSFATLVTFLDWVKDMKVVPSQFDRSLWGGKFAGSTGGQLMTGLRFLKLLHGDAQAPAPMPDLEMLARASAADRKPLVKQLLANAYGADMVDKLPTMTPKMFDDAMRALGTTESTHQKAVSFFVTAAKFAEVDMQPGVSKRARAKSATVRKRSGSTGKTSNGSGGSGGSGGSQKDDPKKPLGEHDANAGTGGDSKTVQLKSGGTVTLTMRVSWIDAEENEAAALRELIQKFRALPQRELEVA